MSVSQAIKQMTSLAAAHMGFKKRGMIAVGYPADIVMFSP
ncbi:MAG: amidohydrolase family protein [Sphingobacteriales bacterium]|nr:amidohydrolase family protein [Sphingobacteriales bacterium]